MLHQKFSEITSIVRFMLNQLYSIYLFISSSVMPCSRPSYHQKRRGWAPAHSTYTWTLPETEVPLKIKHPIERRAQVEHHGLLCNIFQVSARRAASTFSIETLAVKIPLILLESGHSSACMMEELKDCYEMKTAKLSLNIILQKCCS